MAKKAGIKDKKSGQSADRETVELDKAYEAAAVEDRIYAAWEASGFFNPDNLPGKRTKPFTIMMPPPNATGTLHVGHAMFLTLEDLMTRFHRLRGEAALWLPGTDHAAIATNTKVEKILAKEGKTKYDLGRDGFLKRVGEFVEGSRGTIRRQIRKMGSSCDWSREAFTLDEPRSRAVVALFKKMYDDGLIYRGFRIVNWCPRCESTLADDEVEYKEEPAKLYYMKYGPFVVATTRPETKLGDTGVAVHPDDERYQKWIGQMITVDFGIGPQEIRVIADASVDRNFGTGMVGLTPAHSAVDFEMAEKNLLPVKKIIGEDGRMTALAGKYAGLPVAEARAKFVADLEAKGLIEKIEEIKHSISVCYRCGTVVEPLTSRQWFVDVDVPIPGRGRNLKQLALDAVRRDGIKIYPERFEKVYFHWMENLRDWCISRQIWYGHRIPVWYCRSCYAGGEDSGRAGVGGKESGARAGIVVSAEHPGNCPACGRGDLDQDKDTLDTWFSSGTWTFSTLGWPEKTKDLKKFHPTQVLETGYDILFFWIARMILMTTYALKQIPFEKVYLHGLVRDEQGRKMSKSLENIIDPLDVSAKYGTDAVRLSLVIGGSAGNDLKLSEEKIAYFRNFTNKLWNISRFIQMSCGVTKLGRDGVKRPTPKTLADRWILGRFDEVVRSVTKDIEELNFSRAGETLRDFTWTELADWYLEIAKLEKGKEHLLAFLLREALKLWHPFMPFVTEEIYGRLFGQGGKDLLMVAVWPKVAAKRAVPAVKEFALVQEAVVAIRNLRSTYKVEPGKVIEAVIFAGAKLALFKKQAHLITGLAKVGDLKIAAKGKQPEKAAGAVVGKVQIFVPLGSLIDLGAEKKRLEAEIVEAERYLAALAAKLGNENFVARAPAPVVAAEKEKLAVQKEKVGKLKEQLAQLG
ncbi:MAG: valine--tRNA ligase [Patescibacteria group bacterium]|jgi:valyl-tRNA synthetase